jgi:hypothetical protein
LPETIFGDERYKTRAVPHRLAFREFGALMGAKCYTNDADVIALTDSVIEVWGNFLNTTVEELKPITMVMYSAALLPTGMISMKFTMRLVLTPKYSFSKEWLKARAIEFEAVVTRYQNII